MSDSARGVAIWMLVMLVVIGVSALLLLPRGKEPTPPVVRLSWDQTVGPTAYSTIVAIYAEQERKRTPAGAWTEAGYYPGGKDLKGNTYVAKGMVCAANMPELGIKRGDWLRITRPGYGSIIVRVNDFGPDRNVFPRRGIDLTPDGARALGMLRCGIANVYVEPLK